MVFGKIAGIFSAFRGSFWSPNASSARYMPTSVVSPQAGSAVYASGFSNSGQKNNLRLSSSLQDLSTYHGLFSEDGDLNGIHSKPPHPLLRENAVSSFSKEKSLTGGVPISRRKWTRAILFLLCLMLFALFIYAVSMYIYTNWSREASKFYVVLDCGSTGTRAYVYQASLSYKRDGSLPIVLKSFNEGIRKKPKSQIGRAYDRMETEPGFDKLVHNFSGLKDAINPLIQWAEKQIPQHSHKSTSLFLYATAGVRRLPPIDSKWLLDKAWTILRRSPFLCERKWVKIISGTEEAYYGWAALNYHTGMLGGMPKKETFGALDLGGSSLQVTFENRENVHDQSTLNIRIGTANHHLNAYSLAGYGLNDAFDKSVTRIFKSLPEGTKVDSVNGNLELKHPCLQSGYKERYICSQCASNFNEGGSPVVGGRIGKGGKPGISLRLIGAPNWVECDALAKVAVNLSEWSNLSPGFDCDLQPCALREDLPRPYGKFYAMSGFFVVYRFFNLTKDATLDDVLEKGREFCEKTWETAKRSVPPQPFIEQYCFRAPYIAFLLREGLHITDKQITIDSGSITWTLGVALLEAGKAFPLQARLQSYEILRLKINPILLITILFMSLLILICALSWVCNWMPRFFRRPYLPLFRHNSASAASVLNVPSPFRFQRWSPINSGDQRVKTPLSPTIAGSQQGPFGIGHGLGGSSIQLTDTSSFYPSASGVSHSFSSGSLGQMHFDGTGTGSFWSPHRSQMRLQSRRSQSREDLNSSLAEAHTVKV
ncbi:probable apyrase 7 [Punica granatum]|uniref:apyrase n=2 Tax=Punica granatum TaxID=22663 RepID=A0A218WI66_PUNGR|nr:probable apyrase 7 [Punica granatum]OWM72263.1 hypothetical protein CDL15_Pgr018148 [Punica granatum]PKI57246.1 hypothetical protein CRG98_022343 [Punica granatum]